MTGHARHTTGSAPESPQAWRELGRVTIAGPTATGRMSAREWIVLADARYNTAMDRGRWCRVWVYLPGTALGRTTYPKLRCNKWRLAGDHANDMLAKRPQLHAEVLRMAADYMQRTRRT